MDFKNIVLIGVMLLMILFGCKKKTKAKNITEHPVPYVPIDITVYPNDPLNFKIQAIGGWVYINGGINGIIIYRKSQQEFVALERTSSYLPNNPSARAIVMPDNFTCRDTISDSRWQIFDGGVTQGPTQWGLRVYGTNYDGNSLRIRN
ncbi:MAG: hypothetical protein Q7W45_09745 [Bacteroidota bacterium]|nr:hypothetical protein [Bacteroidota bacterium]MDP3143844.1 hypothetical protein [Bacteroidota bacterium]MDP3556498.1 hypothetical protein [Bacteroidota bacterium]